MKYSSVCFNKNNVLCSIFSDCSHTLKALLTSVNSDDTILKKIANVLKTNFVKKWLILLVLFFNKVEFVMHKIV